MTLEHLTLETFKEKVFDYTTGEEFKYKGTTPCLIDCYASWCQPCKMIAPLLEQLQEEYGDKIIIYKIDVDDQPELSQMFSVRSIPTLFYVPLEGKMEMSMGASSKTALKDKIDNILLK